MLTPLVGVFSSYFLCADAEPDGIGGGTGRCEPLAEPDATNVGPPWALEAEAGVIANKTQGSAARTRKAETRTE